MEFSPPLPSWYLKGNVSNDDGVGNENGIQAIGLDWQNNNFARESRLFLYSYFEKGCRMKWTRHPERYFGYFLVHCF